MALMPKPTVYIETTIVSYLTAWPSREVIRSAHQELTREWWKVERPHFELYASELVVRESKAGDATAAKERLDAIAQIPLLAITDDAMALAEHLIDGGALPRKAAADALHLAIAAVNRIEYLMTWNCRHLANVTMRDTIERACAERGKRAPKLCTPEELTGDIEP
jgi:hypothetical protein